MRLYDLINDPKSGPAGAVTYIILMSLVLLSSVVLCLGTLPEFKDNEQIEAIEWACAPLVGISQIFVVNDAVAGGMILGAIGLYSPAAAAHTLLGSSVGVGTALALGE